MSKPQYTDQELVEMGLYMRAIGPLLLSFNDTRRAMALTDQVEALRAYGLERFLPRAALAAQPVEPSR